MMSGLVDLMRRHRNSVLLLVSGLIVPLITELVSSWLGVTFGRTPSQLIQLLAIAAFFGVALWVLYRALSEPQQVLVPREQRPPRFPGLIVLVGPGRPGEDPMAQAAKPAIDYHLRPDEQGRKLRVCWIVTSSGEGGAVPVAEVFREQYEGRCQVLVRTVRDAFDVQDTYELVRHIYTQEAPTQGLSPAQVIADFTGGTRMMSAGMVLACQDHWPMEYMTGHKRGIASTPLFVRFEPASGRGPQGS